MVQVGFRAELHQLPAAVLAAKRHAELLAILEPIAAPGGSSVRGLRQIDHQQRSGASSKTFDFQLHESSPDLTDRSNPAHQVAGFIPAFERAGATCTSR